MTAIQRPQYRHLRIERSGERGAIVTITLARPDRKNALGPVLINDLLWALDDARDDPAVRVIVLAGEGKAFCAGADLREMLEPDPDGTLAARGDFGDLLLRFPKLHKPTIAKVHGVALGGGLGLAASCHFAIAAESAQLGTPEVLRGLFPMQIMAVLERLVPRRKLIEMMLLGRTVAAREAETLGLITRAVADAELEREVDALAQQLASHAPVAIQRGLAAHEATTDKAFEEAVPYLREQLASLLAHPDAMEGLAAFLQKRKPHWKG
ncbi:MAG TPA: enoyl-CoA hydratase-related protein [Polyangiales bacterium]